MTQEIPLPLYYTPLCLPDAGYDIRGKNVTLTVTRHDAPQYYKAVCRVGPTELPLSQQQPLVYRRSARPYPAGDHLPRPLPVRLLRRHQQPWQGQGLLLGRREGEERMLWRLRISSDL